MVSQKNRALVILSTILLLCSIPFHTVMGQDEADGFTEDFDTINWEMWEYSQDVVVDKGVLRISPGNFVLRFGDWSEIDMNLRLRFQPPGEVVVNYYLRDEEHYALVFTGDVAILQRFSHQTETILGESTLENFKRGDWNDINIKVVEGSHTITVNQVTLITATDPDPLITGAVMLHSLGETIAEFDSLSLTGIPGGMVITEGQPPAGEAPPPEGQEPGQEIQPPPEEQPQIAGEALSTPSATTAAGTGATGTQSLIQELLSGQTNQLELTTFLINLILAAVTSFILGRVYIYWGSSLSNRRAFASNFMLLTVTTTFIILVVRSSVALSLGLVGALSIVRFRAAVKEPEELAYLFFAISLGIGLGDNQRLITLLTLLVAIILMGLLRLFRNTKADVNLHLTVSSQNPGKADLDQINSVLEKHCSKIKLLRCDETEDTIETSYLIEFKRVSDLSQAKTDLRTLSPAIVISFLDNKGIW